MCLLWHPAPPVIPGVVANPWGGSSVFRPVIHEHTVEWTQRVCPFLSACLFFRCLRRVITFPIPKVAGVTYVLYLLLGRGCNGCLGGNMRVSESMNLDDDHISSKGMNFKYWIVFESLSFAECCICMMDIVYSPYNYRFPVEGSNKLLRAGVCDSSD